jgi:HlyD family secretion protein
MKRLVLLLLAPLAVSCSEPSPQWQGYAEGEYLRLGAPQAGWIESVEVERGAQVTTGTRLYTLESEQQRAAVREAEGRLATAKAQLADLKLGRRPEEIAQIAANLSEARAGQAYAEQDLARQQMLARADVAAQARLDLARSSALEAKARVAAMEAQMATARLPARTDQIAAAEATVASAQAALAQAVWQLDQRTIKAPADALVEDTVRKAGEWVSAGGTVISLLPAGNVKVRFFVPEPAMSAIRTGQRVALHCDGCPAGITATVRYVAPQAEFTPPVIYSIGSREKLVFMVEAWPDAGAQLHPGQPVDIDPSALDAPRAPGAPTEPKRVAAN